MTDLPRPDVSSPVTVRPPLPGAVGVSLLHVYDTATPDGLVGGSAHVHFVCTEGYVVLGGRGAVQTLSAGGFAQTPLERGSVVWFTPGTVHRLLNHDGKLEILTLMQNAGLPEAGDAVLTFPSEVLADAASYRQAVDVGAGSVSDPEVKAAAIRRRDLAIDGFSLLRDQVEREGPEALESFYSAALALVRDRIADWRRLWERKALHVAELTGAQLDALERGDLSHLADAGVFALDEPSAFGKPGMCGALDVYHATSQ